MIALSAFLLREPIKTGERDGTLRRWLLRWFPPRDGPSSPRCRRPTPRNPRGAAPGPRPCGPHWHALRGEAWHPLGDAAAGAGLWVWDDRLATVAQLAGGRGVGGRAPNAARSPRRGCPPRLEPGLARCGACFRKKGGEATGPTPTDRGKPGTKRHRVVARTGIPLAIRLSPATGNACTMRATLGDAIPSIRCPSGQRRTRPAKRHADTGDAYRFCRDLLRQRHITPASRARGPSPVSGWGAIAGWSSAPWPG